jgi:hypothetical protein
MKTLFSFLILLTILSSQALAQKQGLCGQVTWTSGNQMPGPGLKSSKPPGIVREIYIYEATTNDQTTLEGGFYASIQTKLVKKIKSKKSGSFSVKLPPGTYSVFVKEDKGLWANTFDGQGIINPVKINSNSCTQLVINVNYMAAY